MCLLKLKPYNIDFEGYYSRRIFKKTVTHKKNKKISSKSKYQSYLHLFTLFTVSHQLKFCHALQKKTAFTKIRYSTFPGANPKISHPDITKYRLFANALELTTPPRTAQPSSNGNCFNRAENTNETARAQFHFCTAHTFCAGQSFPPTKRQENSQSVRRSREPAWLFGVGLFAWKNIYYFDTTLLPNKNGVVCAKWLRGGEEGGRGGSGRTVSLFVGKCWKYCFPTDEECFETIIFGK